MIVSMYYLNVLDTTITNVLEYIKSPLTYLEKCHYYLRRIEGILDIVPSNYQI